MLDFAALAAGTLTLDELTAGLDRRELGRLTDEMIDTMLALIAHSADVDVTFVPQDSAANDPYATDETEIAMPWTLGHVIVHTTASAEESAALAAELARGVKFHGRSRAEVPWRSVTTIEQCRERLEESRRMRHASLEMWPAKAHLENRYQSRPSAPAINAIGRFVLGLRHDANHLDQIADVVEQARGGRQYTAA